MSMGTGSMLDTYKGYQFCSFDAFGNRGNYDYYIFKEGESKPEWKREKIDYDEAMAHWKAFKKGLDDG